MNKNYLWISSIPSKHSAQKRKSIPWIFHTKTQKKIPHKIILQQKEEKKLHDLAYAAWYTDYNSQKKVSKSHISIFIFPFFFLQFSSENVLAQNLKILIWNNKKKSDKKYGNCVWAEPSQLMRVSKCSRSFHFFNKIFKKNLFGFSTRNKYGNLKS